MGHRPISGRHSREENVPHHVGQFRSGELTRPVTIGELAAGGVTIIYLFFGKMHTHTCNIIYYI